MVIYRDIDEVIRFITSSPNPDDVLSFKPPVSMEERIEYLIQKKKDSELNLDENLEVERLLIIEHIMRLAKNNARAKLGLI